MQSALIALLLVILVLLAWRAVNRERREYARFKALRSTKLRQRTYRRWLVESVLINGGLSVAVVIAAWEFIPQVLAEAQAWPPVAWLREWIATPVGMLVVVAAGIVLVLLTIAPLWLFRGDEEVPMVGDIRALLPRNNAELPYGAGLALSAGIFEETLFRLGLPALVYGITGNAAIAFFGCALLFGLLHLYQKAVGVIVATVLGLVLTLVYVVSGSILLVIAIHAIIDLRSLVLLPLLINRPKTSPQQEQPQHPAPPPSAPGTAPRADRPPSR